MTTLTFPDGDFDHVSEQADRGNGIGEWVRDRQWCGQTVFTFPVPSDSGTVGNRDSTRLCHSGDAALALPGRTPGQVEVSIIGDNVRRGVNAVSSKFEHVERAAF